jgi:streptogramin lyase
VRLTLALCLVLAVACTSQIGQPSPNASPRGPKLASGGVVEYPVPDPSPLGAGCLGCGTSSLSGITSGHDGNVWFFDVGKTTVGRITPRGAITEFAVPATGAGSEGIVGAPDGDIWMVARLTTGADWILKVSPAGVITRFPLPDGVGPEGITWGPDGNIWFTEFWTGRVGRLTPSGTLTEFPVPGSNPRGIATGPDHNLWFVDSSIKHEAIATMTVKGAVTIEYRLGGSQYTNQLQPNEIKAGGDGNLWFTESGRIGRINTAGVITQFPLSGANSPSGLALGADGNMWFTSNANAVGRITPAGVIRQFALPRRNSQPLGIAAGSDGRMWFTEVGVNSIASIGLTVPENTPSTRVLNFGPASRSMQVNITNTGDGPLRMVSATVAGPDHAMFNITDDKCSGHTEAAGAHCAIDVAFSPGAGDRIIAAYLNVVDNATGSPHFISLLGRLPDCRLPLYTNSPGRGQYLSVATGTVADDSSGAFVTDNNTSRSVMTPVLYGTQPASFDQGAKRWVPAPTEAVSPDGTRYAYVEFSQVVLNRIHVVDVGTGRDSILPLPIGFWAIIGFAREGIYVDQRYEGIGPGLTLVDPDSGAMRTLFSDSAAMFVSGQMAWIGGRDATDPLPQPPGIGGAFNEVQSRDLKTSATTTWIYRPGSSMYVITGTEGSVVVTGYDANGSYVWFANAPGQAEAITGPELANPLAFPVSRIDTIGLWLGTLDGLFLWTHRTGPILVADTVAAPAGTCA